MPAEIVDGAFSIQHRVIKGADTLTRSIRPGEYGVLAGGNRNNHIVMGFKVSGDYYIVDLHDGEYTNNASAWGAEIKLFKSSDAVTIIAK